MVRCDASAYQCLHRVSPLGTKGSGRREISEKSPCLRLIYQCGSTSSNVCPTALERWISRKTRLHGTRSCPMCAPEYTRPHFVLNNYSQRAERSAAHTTELMVRAQLYLSHAPRCHISSRAPICCFVLDLQLPRSHDDPAQILYTRHSLFLLPSDHHHRKQRMLTPRWPAQRGPHRCPGVRPEQGSSTSSIETCTAFGESRHDRSRSRGAT